MLNFNRYVDVDTFNKMKENNYFFNSRYHFSMNTEEEHGTKIPRKCIREVQLYLRYDEINQIMTCVKKNFFRLFFMMGLNWYLEIFSSLIFNIRLDGMFVFFLDSVNMLQGVWVFGNFICQRNIKDALFKAMNLITRSSNMS